MRGVEAGGDFALSSGAVVAAVDSSGDELGRVAAVAKDELWFRKQVRKLLGVGERK